MMTITSKGQVTFPKKVLEAIGANVGDRLVARIEKRRVVIEPKGRGILDLVGKTPKIKIPKGKTVEELIHEATTKYAAENIRGH